MKNLRMQNLIFNVLFVIVTALSLASCQQHILVATSSRESVANFENSGGLAVTVANFVDQLQRTIAPSQLTGAELQNASNYTLTLTGTSGRMELPPQNLRLTNGTTTINDVPEGLWELTLTATNVTTSNGLVANSPMLQGKAVAQVDKSGMTDVSFILTPLETGLGSLRISVNIDRGNIDNLINNTDIQKTHIGLYEKGTDTRVTGLPYDTYDGKYTTNTYNYPSAGISSLEAGEYDLRVEFKLYGKLTAVWKESIIVEPGRFTNGTLVVPHILKLPGQPTWQANAFDATVQDNGLFDVTLNWNRPNNVQNVTSYEIELKQLPTTQTTNITTDNDWNRNTNPTYTINGLPDSSNHFSKYMNTYPVSLTDGITSLDRNTTSLKLTLASGRYVYRMRSIGHSGQQIWTYGSSILMPIPNPPASAYYSGIGPFWGGIWQGTVNWGAGDYATEYELQTIQVPSATNVDLFKNEASFQNTQYKNNTTSIMSYTGPNRSKAQSGIPPNSVYYFRVRSRNVSGVSDWVYYPTFFKYP